MLRNSDTNIHSKVSLEWFLVVAISSRPYMILATLHKDKKDTYWRRTLWSSCWTRSCRNRSIRVPYVTRWF